MIRVSKNSPSNFLCKTRREWPHCEKTSTGLPQHPTAAYLFLVDLTMVCRTLPLLLLLALAALQAQAAKPEDAVRKFAQDFYGWYVPIAVKDNKEPASDIAIKQRPSSFSPQLLEALRDDAEAQAKAIGELVGLDFDPFLNSQDPSNHFVIGQINLKNDGYWVDIHTSKPGKAHAKPDVIAVVNQSGGHWFFTNFRFPDGGDLLKTLQLLKQEREQSSQ